MTLLEFRINKEEMGPEIKNAIHLMSEWMLPENDVSYHEISCGHDGEVNVAFNIGDIIIGHGSKYSRFCTGEFTNLMENGGVVDLSHIMSRNFSDSFYDEIGEELKKIGLGNIANMEFEFSIKIIECIVGEEFLRELKENLSRKIQIVLNSENFIRDIKDCRRNFESKHLESFFKDNEFFEFSQEAIVKIMEESKCIKIIDSLIISCCRDGKGIRNDQWKDERYFG
jgi:predicted transcriptional regulator